MLTKISGTTKTNNNYKSKVQNEPSFGLMARIKGLDHDYLNPPLRHFYTAIETLEKEGAHLRAGFLVGKESRTYIACENKKGRMLKELLAKFGLDSNFELTYKKIDVNDIPISNRDNGPEVLESVFNETKFGNKLLSVLKSIFGISK